MGFENKSLTSLIAPAFLMVPMVFLSTLSLAEGREFLTDPIEVAPQLKELKGITKKELKVYESEVKSSLNWERAESQKPTESKLIGELQKTGTINYAAPTFEDGDEILVEIYQKPTNVKAQLKKVNSDKTVSVVNETRQFMVVKQNNKIRYVFQVSAAAKDRSTPGGTNFPVSLQAWRHMSSKYPSQGKNNMDHVSFFISDVGIGFHSTVFPLYWKLGKPDSHGCVRMARPEARALYDLIFRNRSTTKVNSYNKAKAVPDDEVETVTKLLGLDIALIEKMKSEKNDGDTIPENMSYKTYAFGRAFNRLDSKQIEISKDQDNSGTEQ